MQGCAPQRKVRTQNTVCVCVCVVPATHTHTHTHAHTHTHMHKCTRRPERPRSAAEVSVSLSRCWRAQVSGRPYNSLGHSLPLPPPPRSFPEKTPVDLCDRGRVVYRTTCVGQDTPGHVRTRCHVFRWSRPKQEKEKKVSWTTFRSCVCVCACQSWALAAQEVAAKTASAHLWCLCNVHVYVRAIYIVS